MRETYQNLMLAPLVFVGAAMALAALCLVMFAIGGMWYLAIESQSTMGGIGATIGTMLVLALFVRD